MQIPRVALEAKWGGVGLPGLVVEMMLSRADTDRAMSVTIACYVVKMSVVRRRRARIHRLRRRCPGYDIVIVWMFNRRSHAVVDSKTTYRRRTMTATDLAYCCNSSYKVASVCNLTLDPRVVGLLRSLFCRRPFALSASLRLSTTAYCAVSPSFLGFLIAYDLRSH